MPMVAIASNNVVSWFKFIFKNIFWENNHTV